MHAFRRVDAATTLLWLAVLTDLLFVALHLLHTYTAHAYDARFAIDLDRGFAEVFQYVKFYWMALLFGSMAVVRTSATYAGWALAMTYLGADDSMRFHERAGRYLAEQLALPPMLGLRAVDFGELFVTAAAGAVLLAVIAAGYLRAPAAQRALTRRMGALLVALAFFGVFVDMVHIEVMRAPPWDVVLGLIEDGGEMLVASVMLAVTFRHWCGIAANRIVPALPAGRG